MSYWYRSTGQSDVVCWQQPGSIYNAVNGGSWLTGRASDLCIADTGFDSRPGRCRARTLGKFLKPVCNVVLYNNII